MTEWRRPGRRKNGCPHKRKQAKHSQRDSKAEVMRQAMKGMAELRESTTEGLSCLGDAVTLGLESLRKESEGSILITPLEGRAS